MENHIVGAPCGVMDQMTSACGEANKLLAMLCQVSFNVSENNSAATFYILRNHIIFLFGSLYSLLRFLAL